MNKRDLWGLEAHKGCLPNFKMNARSCGQNKQMNGNVCGKGIEIQNYTVLSNISVFYLSHFTLLVSDNVQEFS